MIRLAEAKDLEPLMTLTRNCARHMISQGIFQWNEHYPSSSAFEHDIERQELYLLEVDAALRGSIVVSTHKDNEYLPIQWLSTTENNIYIHRLAIDPHYQGQGWARYLMDFAEKYARDHGYESVRLDTFSQNLTNQRFYEQRGYQRLGDIYFPKQSEHPFHCYELLL